MLQLLSNLVKIAQMFGHDVLRDRLILAVDDIHVQFPFAALDDGAQLGGILNAIVKGFEKNAVENKSNLDEKFQWNSDEGKLTLGAIRKWPRHCQTPSALFRLSNLPASEYHSPRDF